MGHHAATRRLPFVLLFLLITLGATLFASEPGEISDLDVAADGTLSWSGDPLADTYIVYRGGLNDLLPDYLGDPLEGEISDTSFVDPTLPEPGAGMFYLVTGHNDDGEGSMGPGAGGPRPNNHSWRSVAGAWIGLHTWPSVPVHSILLSTGKVMTFRGDDDPEPTAYTWDPETDTFTPSFPGQSLFCAGHSLLPDGRLFVTGAALPGGSVGPDYTYFFDPLTNLWTQGPDMNNGRYYPTNLTMGDGSVLIFSGTDQFGNRNEEVEHFVMGPPDSISVMPGADRYLSEYPRMHLLPDGLVFHGGPEDTAYTFDPSTNDWEEIAENQNGKRSHGTSVLLPPARVFAIGGRDSNGDDDLGTNSVEMIDMDDASPEWSYMAPMHYRRIHLNAQILPDGTILAIGGSEDTDEELPQKRSEIYDPATNSWKAVATMKSFRLYHSSAVLLLDGRVMASGTNSNPTTEFYSPAYLFRGPRPTIDSAPASVLYGQTFNVETPEAADISSVVFIRPSHTTHATNMSQRIVPLSFSQSGPTGLDVTAPTSSNVAPPGHYMLFILDSDKVPAVAKMVRIEAPAPPEAATENRGIRPGSRTRK